MSGIPAGAGALLGKRLGKYEILALLALGGTAEIYLARIGGAAGFEKYVVVKCLHDHLADDAEFVKMFLDEARLAAPLDHSNIVQTMELGEHEHRYYMVMEFLAGLSLAMIVRRAGERLPGGRLPPPLAVNMIAQACAGLHYAHERTVSGKPLNIVHRDISPQNLVVSFEGVVKVVDFGIAKAELRETRTQSGTIKGKFAYMSPEQCVATNVDRRTDVFALGVILHELLTGRRLFKKPSPYDTYQAVIECAVEPPSRIDPTLDPALDPIVMRAVAKTKEQRYATAEELGDALLKYMHQRGISSGPGDVSRFFEASFAQEIEEHSARMRELISGRGADPGASWAAGEEDAGAQGEGTGARGASSMDPEVPASSSLSGVIGELGAEGAEGGGGDEGDDDDDAPAERTRIESNPLEQMSELDAEHARSRQMQAQKTPRPLVLQTPPQGGPATTPLRPTGARPQVQPPPPPPPQQQPSAQSPRPTRPAEPAQGPRPAATTPRPGMPVIRSGPLSASMPAADAPAAPRPPSGKFPEAANLPTMIAQPDGPAAAPGPAAGGAAGVRPAPAPSMRPAPAPAPVPGLGGDDDDDDGESPELAKTELGAAVYPSGSDPNAMTVLEMAAPNLEEVRARMGLPRPGQPPAAGEQGPQPPGAPGAQPPGAPAASPGPPMAGLPPEQLPAGYAPPPGPGAGAPVPMAPPAPPRPQNMPPIGPAGYPVMSAEMRDQMASGATVFPSSSSGAAPDPHRPMDLGGHPMGQHPMGQHPMGQHPMGQHPMTADWPGAPKRAMPPWLLAILFIGALGGALLITILLARAMR